MIISKIYTHKRFSFCQVAYSEILKQIKNLNTEKKIQQNDIPTGLLRQNSHIFSNFFRKNVNRCIKNLKFPSDLKLADVTPRYQRNQKP